MDIYRTNIDESAIIRTTMPLPESVTVGPHAVIEENVTIGPDTVIQAGAYIGPNVRIGKRCFIGANTCIGRYGFKYQRDDLGVLHRVDYSPGVIIENDVEIDPLVSIHPGHFGPTIIGARTKIDGLVHVGHDNTIGPDCIIAAGTTLGGVITLGEKCNLGIAVVVKPRVKVPDGTRVGSGAVITKSFQMPGLILAGNPADTLEELVERRQTVGRMMGGQAR